VGKAGGESAGGVGSIKDLPFTPGRENLYPPSKGAQEERLLNMMGKTCRGNLGIKKKAPMRKVNSYVKNP